MRKQMHIKLASNSAKRRAQMEAMVRKQTYYRSRAIARKKLVGLVATCLLTSLALLPLVISRMNFDTQDSHWEIANRSSERHTALPSPTPSNKKPNPVPIYPDAQPITSIIGADGEIKYDVFQTSASFATLSAFYQDVLAKDGWGCTPGFLASADFQCSWWGPWGNKRAFKLWIGAKSVDSNLTSVVIVQTAIDVDVDRVLYRNVHHDSATR